MYIGWGEIFILANADREIVQYNETISKQVVITVIDIKHIHLLIHFIYQLLSEYGHDHK